MTLPNVLIVCLVLAVATLFSLGSAPRQARLEAAPPPTPAALAFGRERAAAAEAAEAARHQVQSAQAMATAGEDESVLPEGEGRTEVFAICTACHNTAVIRRSAFTRNQWDDLMDWMAERQGMNPLEGELRDIIVDYLARHFGPRPGPRGGANPFLN